MGVAPISHISASPIPDPSPQGGRESRCYCRRRKALESYGLIDAAVFYVLGLVIYFVMRSRTKASGVDSKMLFTELPPD